MNFTGFGKFSTLDRAARMGVNPRTGEKVHIAAATVPKFSAGSKLKATVKAGGRPVGELLARAECSLRGGRDRGRLLVAGARSG